MPYNITESQEQCVIIFMGYRVVGLESESGNILRILPTKAH